MEEEIKEIANHFLIGEPTEIRKLNNGRINTTFLIKTSEGDFIIQKLNPIFDKQLTNTTQKIGRYLRTKGFPVPVLLSTKYGEYSVSLNGERYRAFEYIPNEIINDTNKDEKISEESGRLLGRFHRLMKEFNHQIPEPVKDFHNTKKLIHDLETYLGDEGILCKKDYFPKKEIQFILDNIKNHSLLNEDFSSIIHADVRTQNILFKQNKAVAFIDLDMVMKGNLLIDLGDGFRNFCRINNQFNKSLFLACIKGYKEENQIEYSNDQIKDSIGLFTLELAAKFSKYYFEGSLFSLNEEKYHSLREQNLCSIKEYIKYYKSIFN